MTPCFFTRAGSGLTSTDLPVSPWNPAALNGVAVGGLLATLIEELAPPSALPVHWVRLHIDLLGAVPAGFLEPRYTLVRGGRQMQLHQVELIADGRTVARAQGLRVRDGDTPGFEFPIGYDLPDAYPPAPPQTLGVLRHTDQRVVAGRNRQDGPGVLWINFGAQVIGGTPLSPLTRTAMAADFGGGTGNMLGADPYSSPNLDISLFLMREPVGEWVLTEAITESAGNGTGITSSRLADVRGTFARTHQSIFVERTDEHPDHFTS
ncbi:MAG: thioesterase family protein [Sphingobium sp.]